MTKTCSQCGAILPSQVRVCSFCESPLAPSQNAAGHESARSTGPEAWRTELATRMESYRSRRRKPGDPSQSSLDFAPEPKIAVPVAVAEHTDETAHPPVNDDFSFTIAIGRCKGGKSADDSQFVIDVSEPAQSEVPLAAEAIAPATEPRRGLYPVAPLEERRLAAIVDGACLLFACGGFLALFGSLGGQFTFSKLSATVYSIAFAIVYIQYFCLFTVFGGTTPGMMLRNLRVVDFSGEAPTPRQLLRRAIGYLLSAGTFFLGFLWAMWDEDELTWHDRISHTYLSSAETMAEADLHAAAPQR